MKKVLIFILAMMTAVLFLGSSVMVASAEESTTTEVENEDITEILEKLADSEELTKALQEYLSKYENAEMVYFNEKILPVLIAVGVLMLGGIAMIFPSIKKNKQYNQLLGLYNQSKEMLSNSNLEKQAREDFLLSFGEEVKKIALDTNLYKNIISRAKENKALLEQMRSVLLLVCANEPDAVALLTKTASETVVEEDEIIIENLKAEIRRLSGENAEEIIDKAVNV